MTIEVKERPILFNTEMVKAILDGRKTQTRRIMKPVPEDIDFVKCEYRDNTWVFFSNDEVLFWVYGKCPYGQVGDRLYVKETHYRYGYWRKKDYEHWYFIPLLSVKPMFHTDISPDFYYRTKPSEICDYYKRSSLFLEKELSRITLEITDIRVERVQDISEDDAIAEGVECGYGWEDEQGYGFINYNTGDYDFLSAKDSFITLWNSINGKIYTWETNPFVWCITFKRIEK